jgi:hypothetical protein
VPNRAPTGETLRRRPRSLRPNVAGRLNELELGLVEEQLAPDISHREKQIEIKGQNLLAAEPFNHFMARQRLAKLMQKLRWKEVLGMEKCDLDVYPFKDVRRMPVDA